MKKLNVALVGLGFGGAFADIYKHHPNVGELTLFDTNTALLHQFRDHLGGDVKTAETSIRSSPIRPSTRSIS